MLAMREKIKFTNKLGITELGPTMNLECALYGKIITDWHVKIYRKINQQKLADWYHTLIDKFGDHEFVCDEIVPEENDYSCVYTKNTKYIRLTQPMFFGYIQQLIDELPFDFKYTQDWTVVTHAPGTRLGTHVDNEKVIIVHIPIYTNTEAIWHIEGKSYNMQPGYAYMVNTTIPHGLTNYGDSPRIHLYFTFYATQLHKMLGYED